MNLPFVLGFRFGSEHIRGAQSQLWYLIIEKFKFHFLFFPQIELYKKKTVLFHFFNRKAEFEIKGAISFIDSTGEFWNRWWE